MSPVTQLTQCYRYIELRGKNEHNKENNRFNIPNN